MSYARTLALAVLAAGCMAACGGGSPEPLAAPVTLVAAAPAPTQVRIEGCVVDATARPLVLPVHALGVDGRLLATALSGDDGVFRLQVPARGEVALAAAGAAPLALRTGETDLTVAACLRPSLA